MTSLVSAILIALEMAPLVNKALRLNSNIYLSNYMVRVSVSRKRHSLCFHSTLRKIINCSLFLGIIGWRTRNAF